MRATLQTIAFSILCLSIGTALAQQGETTTAASNDAAHELDRIVVTGEKQGRTLQDTVSSVAVTTSVRMEQENLGDLRQIFDRVANLNRTYGDYGFSIRGIANTSGSEGQLSTVYLDGAALPAILSAGGPNSLWDIAQVEVLRGPQSTIQGQNALAGAIVMRSEDPTMDWQGRLRLQYADPADRKIAAAFSGPLITDELAFRVAVEDRDFNGYIANPIRGTREDAVDSRTARAKLLWTPSAIPGLTARLSYTRADRKGPHIFSYSRLDVPDPYEHRINTSNDPNRNNTRVDVSNLEVDYDLRGPWSLSSVTSRNRSDDRRYIDGDLTPQPVSYTYRKLENDTLSQELRLRYEGERLDGLVGLYWARRKNQNLSESRTTLPTPTATIAALLRGAGFPPDNANAIANLYAQALPAIPVHYLGDNPTSGENAALFADGEFHVNDRFSLLGGFRYDRERYTLATDATSVFAGTYPDPAAFGAPGTPLYLAIAAINGGVASYVGTAAGSTPRNTRNFEAFLPKAGVRYAFNDDVSASFVVQRGYRSGGSSFNIARNLVVAYDPEFTWNYEASLRTSWLDGALTVNANAYYTDWKDKQVVARFGLNDYDSHIVNAGRAHLYGAELEAAHRVGAGFDWYASVGYSRTRYDEFRTVNGASIEDNSGAEFVFAPHWTLAAGANWRFGAGWVANLNANYRGGIYTDEGNEASRLSSRTLVNGRFGYETLDWGAYVFAENLFGEKYIQYRQGVSPNVSLGAPRVIGVALEARW